MEENTEGLEVRLLGEFSMYYRGQALCLGKKQTSRAVMLLQILFYSGSEGISRSRLLEYLFGHDAEGDLAVNLRVIIWQLRRLLKETPLPEEEYICASHGRYRFVSSFPVTVDTTVFEESLREAERCQGAERLMLLKKAIDLGGTFLPALAGEEWVVVAEAHYQRLYFEGMQKLCQEMKELGQYEELFEICKRAAALYPFDEWQLWQMDCLIELNRPEEAMELYEKTAALYFEELSVQPSRRMLEYFRKMSGRICPGIGSFEEIKKQICEKEKDHGAYYCPLPGFFDSCHVALRNMGRSGQSIYLMLCTLTDARSNSPKDEGRFVSAAKSLNDAIRETLRQGDVYTRYNKNQFLVMLMEIRQEEFSSVISRLDACFRKKESSQRVKIHYRVSSLAEMEEICS